MSQNAMSTFHCSGGIEAEPESSFPSCSLNLVLAKDNLTLFKSTDNPSSNIMCQHPIKQSPSIPYAPPALCHQLITKTASLVDSDVIFKYGAATPFAYRIPTKVTWLVYTPSHLSRQNLKSHVPESSHFLESRTHAVFNCCCCNYGTYIHSSHKGNKISIHSLISGAFSTMIRMPHTFSPHFIWLVMLQGYT